MTISPFDRCLRTGAKITGPEWNQQPCCSCDNCDAYFALARKIGREAANKEYDNQSK